MQRWNRRKTHLHLLALLFLLFIVLTILHNEHSIRQIQETPDPESRRQEASISYVKPNVLSHRNGVPGMLIFTFFLPCGFNWLGLLRWSCLVLWVVEILDRFSKCNGTKQYSGRKISWDGRKSESGRRKVRSERCDVFSGKWVFDNTSYPLYNESQCPYMSDQLACHKHGRSDLRYQYWRWQPHGCNLKR